ncbi:dTDP-4-dehydrorhamnose 3,5-epimerase [Nitratireductor aquimarinus]|uniref:dTDP-4-dehydrorhamnose 3,5-epimerase n=1 Tax=Nitratireductor TaxID=245876 RepID=UPI0019D361BE|nr:MULTISPECIES: dTDP-4-dehydrorhamnose 3,5-epimerase [Nitratireductor]MBN7777453.1 dTDP-4-dehydrorhamnose 3,5-epimerase [Nitratireductor pacificus]MBN7781446.1 dTDP-4-dehydrorhamnose 3,5-epimerase [Nitratireductor pacificus]MBN7790252.1 dTDP-4-dehydrorhamnose 3,5-epimerase [Nitratireductor aquimarinus]MBY6099662.1 dTDP-4-dehydrorhamnose 3,5-epimerase [Nitratireductor aquimarinus]MCA1261755.1 dTDP-4-dehydrorhamnose 3,5-epimerase [Nitratireductor aquimarinus]
MQPEILAIPDVLVFAPRKFSDARGFFSETYNRDLFCSLGIRAEFVQDNHSRSEQAGTLRGLHFQTPPHAQAKIVRVLRGSILDVAVDLRRSSPTYGKHVKAIISVDEWNQIFIPEGFAHGFLTLESGTEVAYKTTSPYAPNHDAGLPWDDPDLAIDWGWAGELFLSDKDRAHKRFASFETPFS